MGFLARLRKAKDTAEDLADKHGEQISDGIHKAADFVDDKTGNKYAGAIDKVEAAADSAVDKLDDEPEQPASPTS